MIIFKYRPEKGRLGKIIKRPVALVEFLATSGEWIAKDLYIDSGADITLLPRSVGELLGFKLDKNEAIEEIGGIGGKLPIAKRQVKMKIGDFEFKTKVAWALAENIPLLLGREAVFDLFQIIFQQNKDKIIFKKA